MCMTWRISLHPIQHITIFFIYFHECLPEYLAWPENQTSFLFCIVTRMENVAKLSMLYATFQYGLTQLMNMHGAVICSQHCLKETKTHISSLQVKLFIIENNQWKFEQNQVKNKEVTALWNLAITIGRYSKWWQVVDNSPYVLYMKFYVFPLVLWLRQFPCLKSRYDKQGCILHDILWSRAMKTHVSKENLKRMKFFVQNEWRVVHNCPHNFITALYCSLDLKML